MASAAEQLYGDESSEEEMEQEELCEGAGVAVMSDPAHAGTQESDAPQAGPSQTGPMALSLGGPVEEDDSDKGGSGP